MGHENGKKVYNGYTFWKNRKEGTPCLDTFSKFTRKKGKQKKQGIKQEKAGWCVKIEEQKRVRVWDTWSFAVPCRTARFYQGSCPSPDMGDGTFKDSYVAVLPRYSHTEIAPIITVSVTDEAYKTYAIESIPDCGPPMEPGNEGMRQILQELVSGQSSLLNTSML